MAKTHMAIKEPKPRVLIIHCSDPRFRLAFLNFTEEELGLSEGEFVPINIAGGPAALAHRGPKPGDYLFLIGQIKFFANHFKSIRKIIIISHQDCGYYKTIADHPDKDECEVKDLPRAAKAICREMPNVTVECYYARFTDEACAEVIFDPHFVN